MNILLIGSGGREHSIAKTLAKSPQLTQLYCVPGNPGTAAYGENISLKESDHDGLLALAIEKSIDMVIVGPEAPLVAGLSDLFEANNIPVIGPKKAGAQLEGSKKWAKSFMERHHIPTASYKEFNDYESAKAYLLTENTYPIVIKADGLAAGKGVTVAATFEEAEKALSTCFVDDAFGDAGHSIIIESFLQGEEASILAFCDGKTIIPMVAAQDHKAVFDGDKGPNTGGMGAYSPAPLVTEAVMKKVHSEIFTPLLKGFQDENIDYRGIVYAGLMIDQGVPSIVEFNVRFGDPETQVVLPRLKTDLLTIFQAIHTQTLDQLSIEWHQNACVCIVMAAPGYPGAYPKNISLSNLSTVDTTNSFVIQAGTSLTDDNQLVSSGGRVLGVVSHHQELEDAIKTAYDSIHKIGFEGAHYRQDIGQKALARFKSSETGNNA